MLFEEFPVQPSIPVGSPTEASGRVRFNSINDHILDKK